MTFRCIDCGASKETQGNTGGTGYAVLSCGFLVCYQCCAIRDTAEMTETGTAVLYLTQSSNSGPSLRLESYCNRGHAEITNWPGTLRFNAYVKRGYHNRARYRYDAWFTGPDGKPWHGVQYGENTQIIRCHRVSRGGFHR